MSTSEENFCNLATIFQFFMRKMYNLRVVISILGLFLIGFMYLVWFSTSSVEPQNKAYALQTLIMSSFFGVISILFLLPYLYRKLKTFVALNSNTTISTKTKLKYLFFRSLKFFFASIVVIYLGGVVLYEMFGPPGGCSGWGLICGMNPLFGGLFWTGGVALVFVPLFLLLLVVVSKFFRFDLNGLDKSTTINTSLRNSERRSWLTVFAILFIPSFLLFSLVYVGGKECKAFTKEAANDCFYSKSLEAEDMSLTKEYCNRIGGDHPLILKCNIDGAERFKDYSFCRNNYLASVKTQDFVTACYSGVAQATGDSCICNLIENEQGIDSCKASGDFSHEGIYLNEIGRPEDLNYSRLDIWTNEDGTIIYRSSGGLHGYIVLYGEDGSKLPGGSSDDEYTPYWLRYGPFVWKTARVERKRDGCTRILSEEIENPNFEEQKRTVDAIQNRAKLNTPGD